MESFINILFRRTCYWSFFSVVITIAIVVLISDEWNTVVATMTAPRIPTIQITRVLRTRTVSHATGRFGQPRRSMIVALASPPPSHIVCRP